MEQFVQFCFYQQIKYLQITLELFSLVSRLLEWEVFSSMPSRYSGDHSKSHLNRGRASLRPPSSEKSRRAIATSLHHT